MKIPYWFIKGCTFLVFLLILMPTVLYAEDVPQKTYVAQRLTTSSPHIDGYFDDDAWKVSEWDMSFVMREPYEGIQPSQQTAFKIIFDDENIYVAIKAYDSLPELIEKRLSRRDAFDGDWVGIAFDSYYDKLTAFSFGVSAAGVKNDLRVSNEDESDDSWDPVWYVKTAIVEDGWNAEMKIPLTQIRFARKDELVWGMQVMRWLFRAEEFSVWQHIPQETGRWVSQYGLLTGINGISPKREIELIPYVMGNTERYLKEEGNPFSKGSEYGATLGIDGKIAVTNDFTLNLTVNPDFGQVEADPSEVNLTAFETFFPEKRPFFIEGGNIFNYNITTGDGDLSQDNLFYSRRIGRRPQYSPDLSDDEYIDSPEFTRIVGAFKFSGKTRNGLSIGVMESLTEKATATIGDNENQHEVIVEPRTNYFNTRIQQDYNKGNTIVGGMFTSTNRLMNTSDSLEFLHHSAYTGGLDYSRFWKDKTYYFGAKTIFSQLKGSSESIKELQESPQRYFQRPDANHLHVDSNLTQLMGHGGAIEGGKLGGGHWRALGWVTWRSPGLELNDQGYLRQADIIQQVAWVQYRIWEPFGIFRTFNINVNQFTAWDFAGTRLYLGGNFNFNMQFNNHWFTGAGFDHSAAALNRSELRGGPALKYPGDWNNWISVSTDERKKIVAEFSMFNNWGGQKSSRFANMGIEIKYRPLNSLSFSVTPSYQSGKREMQYVETIDLGNENRYIISTLNSEMISADFRINFSLTPDLSIQYWGQPFNFSGNYSSFKRVTDPLANEYSERFHIFTDSEITYSEHDNSYFIDENQNGITDYSIDNPNFNFFEFRSNLVARWEYIPGSTLYIVWSQGRTGDNNLGEFNFNSDMKDLFSIVPHNVFLIKISYRISI